jgi:hypothetical protein
MEENLWKKHNCSIRPLDECEEDLDPGVSMDDVEEKEFGE